MLILICLLLTWYRIAIFARVLLSWFPMNPNGLMATATGFLYVITDPVIMPVRRMLPPLRLGSVGLDLSPIIAIVAISIVNRLLCG